MVAIPLMKGVHERQEESQNPREPCQVSANSRGAGMHVAPHTVLWLWKHAGCMSVAELPLISVRIWKGGTLPFFQGIGAKARKERVKFSHDARAKK